MASGDDHVVIECGDARFLSQPEIPVEDSLPVSKNDAAPGGCGYSISDVVGSEANCRKLLIRRRRLMVGLKNFTDHLRCATSCEISKLICKFNEIEVEYGDFNRAVGVIMDSELVAELIDGMADQYGKCHCLFDEVKRKLFNEYREEDVEYVVPSDSVSHVNYYSATVHLVKCRQPQRESNSNVNAWN